MVSSDASLPEPASSPSPVAVALVQRASETPDRVAVTDRERTLSFAEFDAEVGAAAARISSIPAPRGRARSDERMVPILPVLVDRSARSAVALHAAFRAGRAFTPLEASLPEARIAEIFDRLDAPVHAVVADPAMRALLPPWVRTVDVTNLDHSVRLDSPVDVEADDVGYVVFTSGSTGGPKGVVRHWSALPEKITLDGVAGNAVVPQVRPFSFSAGLGQLVRVAAGDTLHILDPRSVSTEELLHWLQRLETTRLAIGAALVRSLLRITKGKRLLPNVRVVRFGGEPASWDIVPVLRTLIAPDAGIEVRFSATEVGEVTRYLIGPDHPLGVGPLPIGIAEGNPRVRLDMLEGPDSPMELVVRDPLAQFYLGAPELSAERFFIDEEGHRWWRSGDSVSIDPQGRMVHRGRLDDMVKINGMRIEPRETEIAVKSLPGVSDAVVVVHTTPRGRRVVVAHVVVDDAVLNPREARRQLRLVLPAHLVPGVIVRHEELPVSERGKVDIGRLRTEVPVPWRDHEEREGLEETEVWVAGLVSRIVDLGEVGVDDNIWDHGLDSLGAVELCAAISAAGLGEIDPTILMNHPTPGAIFTYLAADRALNTTAEVVLNPDGTATPIFAVPGGGGTALAFRSLADALGAHQPLVVVEPRGMHQPGEVEYTVEARVDHLLEAIDARVTPSDLVVIMGYSAGAVVSHEACRRLAEQGRRVHEVLLDAVPRGRPAPVAAADGADVADMPVDNSPIDLDIDLDEDDDEAAANAADEGRGVVFTDRGYVRPPYPPEELFEHRWEILSNGQGYYQEWARILRHGRRGFAVLPAPIRATLVERESRSIYDEVRPLVAALRVFFTSGTHQTMLHPPHVDVVAEAIADLFQREAAALAENEAKATA